MEMCKNHGWKLEGSHSTRAGIEKSVVVHFYKVSVKMLEEDKVVRGVGSNKAEAVKRAFKSMELLLRDAINEEDESKVGFRKISNDVLSDNIVNLDENPLVPCEPCPSPQDSLSQPPVFHAQGCQKYSTANHPNHESWAADDFDIIKSITLSDYDAATLMGRRGKTIKNLEKC